MLIISLLIAVLMIVYPEIMTYVPYLGIRKLPPAWIRNLVIALLIITLVQALMEKIWM